MGPQPAFFQILQGGLFPVHFGVLYPSSLDLSQTSILAFCHMYDP